MAFIGDCSRELPLAVMPTTATRTSENRVDSSPANVTLRDVYILNGLALGRPRRSSRTDVSRFTVAMGSIADAPSSAFLDDGSEYARFGGLRWVYCCCRPIVWHKHRRSDRIYRMGCRCYHVATMVHDRVPAILIVALSSLPSALLWDLAIPRALVFQQDVLSLQSWPRFYTTKFSGPEIQLNATSLDLLSDDAIRWDRRY